MKWVQRPEPTAEDLSELVDAAADAAEAIFYGRTDQSHSDRLKNALSPFGRRVDC